MKEVCPKTLIHAIHAIVAGVYRALQVQILQFCDHKSVIRWRSLLIAHFIKVTHIFHALNCTVIQMHGAAGMWFWFATSIINSTYKKKNWNIWNLWFSRGNFIILQYYCRPWDYDADDDVGVYRLLYGCMLLWNGSLVQRQLHIQRVITLSWRAQHNCIPFGMRSLYIFCERQGNGWFIRIRSIRFTNGEIGLVRTRAAFLNLKSEHFSGFIKWNCLRCQQTTVSLFFGT